MTTLEDVRMAHAALMRAIMAFAATARELTYTPDSYRATDQWVQDAIRLLEDDVPDAVAVLQDLRQQLRAAALARNVSGH